MKWKTLSLDTVEDLEPRTNDATDSEPSTSGQAMQMTGKVCILTAAMHVKSRDI